MSMTSMRRISIASAMPRILSASLPGQAYVRERKMCPCKMRGAPELLHRQDERRDRRDVRERAEADRAVGGRERGERAGTLYLPRMILW